MTDTAPLIAAPQDALVLGSGEPAVEMAFLLLEQGELDLMTWMGMIRRAYDSRSERMWLFVQALAYGHDAFGEESWQAIGEFDLSPQTVANYTSVGRRWTREHRSEFKASHDVEGDPPFAYYEAVSRRWLPMDEASDLLAFAHLHGWDRSRLRSVIKQIHPPEGDGFGEMVGAERVGGWWEFKSRHVEIDGEVTLERTYGETGAVQMPLQLVYSDDLAWLLSGAFEDAPVEHPVSQYLAHRIEEWVETSDGRRWLTRQYQRVIG